MKLFDKEIKLISNKEKIPAELLYVVAYGADGSYIDLNKIKLKGTSI